MKKRGEMDKAIDGVIARSNQRIAESVNTLMGHERGVKVLKGFRQFMFESGATGLDSINMDALVVLMKEVSEGRRDFISRLPM